LKRKLYACTGVLSAAVLFVSTALAQRQEVGLTLSALTSGSKDSPGGSLNIGTGVAFQANYGFRLLGLPKVSLLGELHFLASPKQEIQSSNTSATENFASLYVTPGIRLKFFPKSRISPYGAIGGGYALFEQSLTTIDGKPNNAPRYVNRGAFDFGGGLDFRLWHFVGGRIEVRDFYSGNPGFNVPVSGSGFHNVVAGGGFVLRFGS